MLNNFIYHLRLIKGQIFQEPLNKGHRLKLAMDYSRWILLYKYNQKDWHIRFDNGFRSIVKPFPDHDSGSMNIWTRNVDFYDLEFVRRVLRKGDTIIDAGCNVGNRTWALADIIGGAILIDANQKAIERVRENLVLNRLPEGKYTAIQKALGDKEGIIRFSDRGGARTDNKVLGEDEDTQSEAFTTIQMTTIDTIVSTYDYAPAYMKIDVEGYDLLALKGAINTLTSGTVRLVKFELLDIGSLQEFYDFFSAIGWKLFALDENGSPTAKEEYFESLNLFASPVHYADQYLNRV
jgi:FkbM family methyltransferase